MHQPTPTSLSDKTIVEKRDVHASDKSRQAVRALRSGIGTTTQFAGKNWDEFQSAAVLQHAKVQINARITFVILMFFATYLTHFQQPPMIILGWAGVASTLLVVTQYCASVFANLEPESRDSQKWSMRFLVLLGLWGTVWAALFSVHLLSKTDGAYSILTFAGAMVLAGVALVTARYIKYGVLVMTFPIIAMVAVWLAMTGTLESIGLAILLIAACFFFQRIGDLMLRSYITYLKSQAERDQLIMELEASRGISDEARRRAEDANLAKSRFLATMSHELRTPLNAILGFSEVMSKEVMGPLNNTYYKEYVGDIHSSGSHLLKLINEILDLSRVEAGRYELNEEATSLSMAAEESHQMVKLKASDKDVKLIIQIHPELPKIWADARAMRQVILNLLSNALKFTPSGGTIWLKVGWTAGGGQYVSIKDTGPGIPEDEIPIVLSSFGQGSIAIKSAEQGTGLGLPIVQALVQMHDGTFELKSKLREGTEVVATFPRMRILAQVEPIPQPEKPVQKRSFAGRRKVTPPALAPGTLSNLPSIEQL